MLDNLYQDSIESSGQFLRMALQQISRYKLPYNPITYSVWYEYASGKNQQLAEAIGQLERESKEISFETILSLFREYIADQQVLQAEKKTREFQSILTEMTRHLGTSGSRLDNQGNMLEAYAKELGHTTSMEEISAAAKEIVSKTKSMVQDSQSLKQEMDQTATVIDTLKKELEGIKQAAKTDMLTGLLNRRGFDAAISSAVAHSKQNNTPLSVVITDIDHFKKVNDTHGHLIGDNVLKMLSKLLQDHIKGKDIAARFGGEEFIMVLPETPLEGAFVLAEQIRLNLRNMRWRTKDSGTSIGHITISLGVAQYRSGEPLEDLIERSDNALYYAKENGRNRTSTELDIAPA